MKSLAQDDGRRVELNGWSAKAGPRVCCLSLLLGEIKVCHSVSNEGGSRTRPRKNLAGPQLRRLSDFGRLGQSQGIIDINAKVSDRVLYLGVSKQDLNGSKVTGRLVNECRLGAA